MSYTHRERHIEEIKHMTHLLGMANQQFQQKRIGQHISTLNSVRSILGKVLARADQYDLGRVPDMSATGGTGNAGVDEQQMATDIRMMRSQLEEVRQKIVRGHE